MRSLLLLSVTVIFAARTVQSLDTCYFANGTALPDDPNYNEYQPCTSGPTKICCGINRTNPAGGNGSLGFTVDECLPNGLCQNRVETNGVQTTSYWVDFCANKDVTSSDCLNVCDQVRGAFGNAPLTPCTGRADSDRWCCGDSNACCTSNVGVIKLAQVLGGSISSSIVSSATSRASSTSPTGTAASASATSTSLAAGTSKKSGLSGGAIAGIVIGVIAGLALLAAALFFARRAAMYKKKAAAPNYAEAPANPYPPQYPDQGYVAPGSEKYAQQNQHTQGFAHHSPPSELPSAPPSELPSGDLASPTPLLPRK